MNEGDTKSILRGKLKPVVESELTKVEQMARDKGHEVLYSPPHYSDLQPIELVWAVAKGEAGRQYDTKTEFSDVLTRIKTTFSNLESSTVRGCIAKTNEKLEEIRDQIFTIEEEAKGDEPEEASSSDEYFSAEEDGEYEVSSDSE